MATKRTLNQNHFKTCNVGYFKSTETPVQNGLSMSPQQIKSLTEKGIPVSLPNLSIINDTDYRPDYLPLEYRRGVDLNTCFETSTKLKADTIKTYQQFKKLKK